MDTTTTPTIPRDRPALLFERQVPPAWCEAQELPIVGADGDLLLSCGWSDHRIDGETQPAVVSLDGRTGSDRFRFEVPVLRPGRTEGQTSLPRPLPDGRILVAVYQWDTALDVYLLDPAGELSRRDTMASAERLRSLDLIGGDAGIKLFLGSLGVSSGAYLLSWVYRSRRNHLICRDLKTGAHRWQHPEWLLACEAGAVVTETDPPRLNHQPEGAEVRGRSVEDGAGRWTLEPEHGLESQSYLPAHRIVAATMENRILFVDRQAYRDAQRRRDRELVDLAMTAEEDPDWDSLEQRWKRSHPRQDDLVAYDISSGLELWRERIAGAISSVTCDRRSTVALALTQGSGHELVCLGPQGAMIGRCSAVDSPPRLVAVDDELVLWASDSELICQPYRVPTRRELWRLPLPARCRWSHPRPRDRDLRGAAIVSSSGCLYMRDGSKLWAFGC